MNKRTQTTLITLALLSLLAFFMFGCAPCCCPWGGFDLNDLRDLNELTGTGGTVRGTAYIKSTTTDPVPNVTVEIGTHTAQTDADGGFEIKDISPGKYTIRIYGGDLGYTGSVTVKKGEVTDLGSVYLHPTLPPPNTEYPTDAEGVITAYYEAINAKDYSKALTYLTGQMGGSTEDSLRSSYEPYIKSVSVAKIDRRSEMDYGGREIYVVTFTAEYIKQYPAGNGYLPTVHSMILENDQWKITEIGTG